jgi:hypothetical protein
LASLLFGQILALPIPPVIPNPGDETQRKTTSS